MCRATLLISFVLAINGGAAIAATPVFQIKENVQGDGAQRLSVRDTYASDVRRDNPGKAVRISLQSASAPKISALPVVFSAVENPSDVWGGADIVPVAYSRNVDGGGVLEKKASGLSSSGESLFNFLKHFKARPVQKPARWTILLVGLCFVLYQLRRRPMRTSIGGLLYGPSKFSGQQGA